MITTAPTGTAQIIRTAIFIKDTHKKRTELILGSFLFIIKLFIIVSNNFLGDIYRSVFGLDIVPCQVFADNTDGEKLYSADKGDDDNQLCKAVHTDMVYQFSDNRHNGVYNTEQRCQRAYDRRELKGRC